MIITPRILLENRESRPDMDYQNPAPTGDPNIRRVIFEHFRDSQGFQMRIRFLDIFLRKRFRFKDRTHKITILIPILVQNIIFIAVTMQLKKLCYIFMKLGQS